MTCHPNKFAAVVPVCGRSPLKGISKDPYGEIAKKIGRTPVWFFHGSEDRNVLIYQARALLQQPLLSYNPPSS